jgi:hypothetical protein
MLVAYRLGAVLAWWQAGAGQIEIVRDVRDYLCDIEADFALADPAAGKLVTSNGQHFVLGPVPLMNNRINAGDGNHLSWFIRSVVVVSCARHNQSIFK